MLLWHLMNFVAFVIALVLFHPFLLYIYYGVLLQMKRCNVVIVVIVVIAIMVIDMS